MCFVMKKIGFSLFKEFHRFSLLANNIENKYSGFLASLPSQYSKPGVKTSDLDPDSFFAI